MQPLPSVDAINTFRVSAGRFAYFHVVSRPNFQCLRKSQRLLRLVRFPAAPPERCRSGPQALACFPSHQPSSVRLAAMASLRSGTRKDGSTYVHQRADGPTAVPVT